MANILFFCNYQVAEPACGGIVRVTGVLADIFSRKGHSCHLCYYFDNTGLPVTCFESRLILEQHNEEQALAGFIEEKDIDIIILQVPLNNTNWYLLPMLRRLSVGCRCTLIHCFHTLPFAECRGYDRSYFKYMLSQNDALLPKLKKQVWASVCMLFPKFAVRKTASRYDRICSYCDRMILLSERYIPFFISHVSCRKEQIMGIMNPMSFPFRLPVEELAYKTRTVVIVGRLDESTKRLSKAIRIWSLIEKKYNVKDWSLIFIGDGPDNDYYRQMVSESDVHNITFAGRQDPVEYYRKASILMSTSAIEGLPMVILEAMQMGCVPVAFDSFDAVYDLISDSENGYIVKYNDLDGYASRLYHLMTHDDERRAMMERCLAGQEKFQADRIYDRWKTIIETEH